MPPLINVDQEFMAIRGPLKSYLYRLTASREDAEDLMQDTYVRVREKHHTFKGSSSFKTWTFTIATNLARDNHRVQKRWPADAQDQCRTRAMSNPEKMQVMQESFASQGDGVFDLQEHIQYCFGCLSKNLTLDQQVALVLKEVYSFSRTEIAEILNVTEGVVKHLLFEGRRDMQEKYAYRCALVSKQGVCYQCAELNDGLQQRSDSAERIKGLPLSQERSPDENFDLRMKIISALDPLTTSGAALSATLVGILREAIGER